jgi:alanine racemase
MLEGIFKAADIPLLHKYALTPVIHNAEQVEMLRLAAHAGDLDVYVKVNSGMNRARLRNGWLAARVQRDPHASSCP